MDPDLEAVRALIRRRDHPTLIAGYEAAINRVVIWRWTRDQVVISRAPFARELNQAAPRRELTWHEEEPPALNGWSQYGFDRDGAIVAWRVQASDDAPSHEGARWSCDDEVIAIDVLPDGRVSRLAIDRAGRDGRVVSSDEIWGNRRTDDVALEVTHIEHSEYEYVAGRPIRLRCTATTHASAVPPAGLTETERAEPPWNLLPELPERVTAEEPVIFEAEYVGARMTRIWRLDDDERTVVWDELRTDDEVGATSPPIGDAPALGPPEAFATVLAAAIADDAAAHPPRGELLRAVIRWSAPDEPTHLTIHLLGTGDDSSGAEGENAWRPLEWANRAREIQRTERVLHDARVAESARRLEVDADASHSFRFGTPSWLADTVALLPDALARRRVGVSREFAVTATSFEGDGGLALLRESSDPSAFAGLRTRGELPSGD